MSVKRSKKSTQSERDMEEVKANREIGEREYKLAVDGRKKSSTERTVSSQNQSKG